MRICETLGEDLQVFMRLWESIRTRIREDSCKTLGEDSQGFVRPWERIRKDSRDFGRGFARICKTRLWERICKYS